MVNGAGLAMATMDIIKFTAASRRTSSMSAAGRAGAGDRRLPPDLSDPKVKAILVNIFGGIMKCDVIAKGSSRGPGGESPRPPRRPPAGHERRARQEDPRGSGPADHRQPTSWRTPPRRWSRPSRRPTMTTLSMRRQTRSGPGDHRQPGLLPRRPGVAYGTKIVGGVTPGKGGSRFDVPIFNTVRGPSPRPVARPASSFAAALRRRRDPRGRRRRIASDRLHHRRHPGSRHGQGSSARSRAPIAHHRPELPGRHHPRPVQDRHHAWPHPQAAAKSASSGAPDPDL